MTSLGKLSYNNTQRSGQSIVDTNSHNERDEPPSMSGGAESVFGYCGLGSPLSIEPDDEFRKRKSADEIVDEHTTAREVLLLSAGLDPSERREPEAVVR